MKILRLLKALRIINNNTKNLEIAVDYHGLGDDDASKDKVAEAKISLENNALSKERHIKLLKIYAFGWLNGSGKEREQEVSEEEPEGTE